MPKLSRHEDSAALQVNIDRHVNSHCSVRELQRDMRRLESRHTCYSRAVQSLH